jgi:hypothetical protein
MVAVHYIDGETGGVVGRGFAEALPEEGARVSLDGGGEYLVLNYWELRPESCDVYVRRVGSEEVAS